MLFENIKSSFERKKRRFDYKKSFTNTFSIKPFYSSDYNEPSDMDLIVVTFNAPYLLPTQIRLCRKYLKGNFHLIVCDNSTDETASTEIRNICEQENVTFIRVEDRTVPNGYSNSHAIALNWIWKNIIKQRKHDFALLDHDIFPVKEIDVNNYLKDFPVYGELRFLNYEKKEWYLWPGFSFFSWNYVKNLPLNFHRYRILGFIKHKSADTGSCNWKCLYSNLNLDKLKKCCNTPFITPEQEAGFDSAEIPYNSVRYTDNGNWIHITDGADRYKSNTDKITSTLKFLENI